MRKEISTAELDAEYVELLPERETLFFAFNHYNWSNVSASQTSVALNAGGYYNYARSTALQAISVSQH